MKFKFSLLWVSLVGFLLFTCSDTSEVDPPAENTQINVDTEQNDDETNEETNEEEINTSGNSAIKILSLGDSYTIGTNVCGTCRFPVQLKDRLKLRVESANGIQLKIIARSGWTTTSLINAINSDNPSNDYNLVTLLIGVNNQYQDKPFSLYEKEFPLLVNTAISKAKSDKNKVIVVSIPDYAYTPFGKGDLSISEDIDEYNDFAKNYCSQRNITYVNITDITRQGLNNPALVAFDGLHPSELAYSKFVDKILPLALNKLKN